MGYTAEDRKRLIKDAYDTSQSLEQCLQTLTDVCDYRGQIHPPSTDIPVLDSAISHLHARIKFLTDIKNNSYKTLFFRVGITELVKIIVIAVLAYFAGTNAAKKGESQNSPKEAIQQHIPAIKK